MIYTPKEPKIIATDFDECICLGGFPSIHRGRLNPRWVQKARQELADYGFDCVVFILWTCRAGADLEEAKMFCETHNLPIKYFNENHPMALSWFDVRSNGEPRKIFAHEYWDDRAVEVR